VRTFNLSCPHKQGLQGYLAHKMTPIPKGTHRTLGIGLLQGPRAEWFLTSEVPLYLMILLGLLEAEVTPF
jgi:hypothetical protein